MAMPSKKELDRVRKKLSKIEPTKILPADATKLDKLKFEPCKPARLTRYTLVKSVCIDHNIAYNFLH
jgi:hypothetical protein